MLVLCLNTHFPLNCKKKLQFSERLSVIMRLEIKVLAFHKGTFDHAISESTTYDKKC